MAATTEWVLPEAPPSGVTLALRRRPWLAPTLVGAGLALATAYVAWHDPYSGRGLVPACPLRELTGLDCPGCGGTRAVHALTHGDIGTAFDHNVLLTVVVPLLAVAWAVWLVRSLLATRAAPAARTALVRVSSGRIWKALGVVAVTFAVVRNIDAVPALEYLGSEAAGVPTPG